VTGAVPAWLPPEELAFIPLPLPLCSTQQLGSVGSLLGARPDARVVLEPHSRHLRGKTSDRNAATGKERRIYGELGPPSSCSPCGRQSRRPSLPMPSHTWST